MIKLLENVNKEVDGIRNKSKNLQDTTEYDELLSELKLQEDKTDTLKLLITGVPEVRSSTYVKCI